MNDNLLKILSSELGIRTEQSEAALKLRSEGATIPFIARYRKELTGELDETVLRNLFDRADYLEEIEERKQTILQTIDSQGKLTDELRSRILSCYQKTELEDLYLPYKPKKRTRASIAREQGLDALADEIKKFNIIDSPSIDLEELAAKFVDPEKGVGSIEAALSGAADIIAEEIAENADLRSWTREYIYNTGIFKSSIKDEYEEGSTKYEMYRSYTSPVKSILPHNMLALRRGENEEIVKLDIVYDDEVILDYIGKKVIKSGFIPIKEFYRALIKDAFTRLMQRSIISDIRLERKNIADTESISVFEFNLRQILLAPPAGMKPTLGIDPGFRTGCKLAAVDGTGKFIKYSTIFPFGSDYQKEQALAILKNMIDECGVKLIAIGNGTAGRETLEFVKSLIKDSKEIISVMVSESGASVYSASTVALEEFPELDLTIRGAISIARRLQDPLAELVKIEPKSIGVGQYQHDVDQKLLRKKLEETIESSVNFVGVDLNTASLELLKYVSGISQTLAKNIVKYRNDKGAFRNRNELLKVEKYGPKAFEQSAGFLRIRGGDNQLDNTAVHPESYYLVEMFARDMDIRVEQITDNIDNLKKMDLKKFINDKVGAPTLLDIISELEKPGRDPRAEFKYAEFDDNIKEISDLRIGMILEGMVTNLTHFGAFVDLGVHQDGLVHISEISDNFVKDIAKVLRVGQTVKVRVTSVDEKLKRIQLSIKQAQTIEKTDLRRMNKIKL